MVDTAIKAFFIDFGFAFSSSDSNATRQGRFQASDPDEVIQILVGTTGNVELHRFHRGVAKVGGTGDGGVSGGAVIVGTNTASVPEPGTLASLLVGVAAVGLRRRVRSR
jgi:hypothetical protein